MSSTHDNKKKYNFVIVSTTHNNKSTFLLYVLLFLTLVLASIYYFKQRCFFVSAFLSQIVLIFKSESSATDSCVLPGHISTEKEFDD